MPAAVIVCALAAAAGIVAAGASALGRLAARVGAVAHPGGRHHHLRPTPLAGAIVVLAALAAGAVAADPSRPLALTAAGALAVCLLGFWDDRRPIGAARKLALQSLVAIAVVAGGLGGSHVSLPGLGALDLGSARVPLLALFLVAVMNAVNLLDGLDGLAGGAGAISAATLALLSASTGNADAAAAAACLAAACAAFCVPNLAGRLYLGDQGSLGIGFLLGALALAGSAKTGAAMSLAPVLVLALPLSDASAVALARLRAGHAPWRPDRRHVHHRMLRSGVSPARVRARVWATSAALGAYAVLLQTRPGAEALGPLAGGLVALALGVVVTAALGACLAAGRPRAVARA